MKKCLTFLLALLGLNTACSQQNYENVDVNAFATTMKEADVVLLDVRTDKEFAEGHIGGALHIDVNKDDFVEQALMQVPQGKRIAVYCRSGRRSARAAGLLANAGYSVVNLKGGIMAWQKEQMAVTTDTHEQDVFT
ncbi:MAG: rhodanese-like domain-containing protein, partial [Prevotella sp.]|nr:rhodanese-like domain-containing protein [Prevotella sp.]